MGEIDYLSYGFAAVVLGGGIVGFIQVGKGRPEIQYIRCLWTADLPSGFLGICSLGKC